MAVDAQPSPPRSLGRAPRRRAFCPLCGNEQLEKPVSEVGSPEAALCGGRCAVAWEVLASLRSSESASERVAARRRLEWDSRQPHAPSLSELLLGRWRAGDWAVDPENLLAHLRQAARRAAAAGSSA